MPLFHRPSVGLDISDRSIEAVFVVNKGGRATLMSYGRSTLTPGVVNDGVVVNREELSRVVRKLLADQMTPPLPKGLRRVMFALPESQVFSHVFEVPRAADEDELLKTLSFEADRYFPYHHTEMVPAQVDLESGPQTKRVYFSAVAKATVFSYLDFFSVAGLEPAAIEGEATSIARSICPDGVTEPFVLVDIGARVTSLSVFDRHGTQFSETIATAGDAFTAVIADALKVVPEEAEDLKRGQGLGGMLPAPALKALKAKIEVLVNDVHQAMGYYAQRSGRIPHRLYLCGGSMLMPGLLEHLTSAFKDADPEFVATLADPLQCLTIDANLEKMGVRNRGVLIATAIGLALRGAGITKFPDLDFLKNARHLAPKPVKPPKGGVAATPIAASNVPRSTDLFRKLPHGHRFAVIVASFLGIIVGIWFLGFKGVLPTLKKVPVPGLVATIQSVTETFAISTGSAPDTIQGSSVVVSQDVTERFQHEGSVADGKATGTIQITNNGSTTQTLIPTTRFLSESGVLFRLADRVTVPARKSATATITADKVGKAGDVAPGRFTIPGLPKAQQATVYGTSNAAFTGGEIATGEPLTSEEFDKDIESLVQQTMPALTASIRAQSNGLTLLDGLIGNTDAAVISGPMPDAPTGPFDLKLHVDAQAIVFDEAPIRQALSVKAQSLAPNTQIAPSDLGPIRYTVTKVDLVGGTAVLEATANLP